MGITIYSQAKKKAYLQNVNIKNPKLASSALVDF